MPDEPPVTTARLPVRSLPAATSAAVESKPKGVWITVVVHRPRTLPPAAKRISRALEWQGRDVLASNELATAPAPYYRPGVKLARATFLDPRVRDLYDGDWDRVAESSVAGLRALVGPEVDDPRFDELVGELSVLSDRFRQLWARHDARPKRSGTARLDHPLLGPLELGYEKLPIPGADRQTLAVYHAEPGSPSARALALLASELLTPGARAPRRDPAGRGTSAP